MYSYVDQLNQILHYLGTPSEDTLRRVGSPRVCLSLRSVHPFLFLSFQAQDYIRSLPIKPRIPFSTLYPHANPLAIDLLSQLLTFDPAKRISCEQALNHPYFAVWHEPSDEPVCDTVSTISFAPRELTRYALTQPFDFGFEEEDSIEGMKKLIVQQVNSFRALVRSQARAAGQARRQERCASYPASYDPV